MICDRCKVAEAEYREFGGFARVPLGVCCESCKGKIQEMCDERGMVIAFERVGNDENHRPVLQ